MTKHFFAWIMIAFACIIALNFQVMSLKSETSKVDAAVALIDSLDLRDFAAYYTSQERTHMEDQRAFRAFAAGVESAYGQMWARMDTLEVMCQD